jgi:hypothetical protein
MKTVVLYNIISFIILVALIFVLRIVSKSNLRQNQQLVIKVNYFNCLCDSVRAFY